MKSRNWNQRIRRNLGSETQLRGRACRLMRLSAAGTNVAKQLTPRQTRG
jgi:hypothetical protein